MELGVAVEGYLDCHRLFPEVDFQNASFKLCKRL